MKKTNPVTYSWRKYIDNRWDLLDNQKYIYACSAKEPPTRFTDGKSFSRTVLFYYNSFCFFHCFFELLIGSLFKEVKKVCTIKTDFVPDMFNNLNTRKTSYGREYRILDYNLNMKVTAEDIEWTVFHQNEQKGKENVSIEYE